jgi:hypothetical protein
MADGEKDPPLGFADRLSEQFVASQMPPVAPDGGLLLEPAALDPLPAAEGSLCSIGPCRNFHELVLSIDAQEPLGEETGVRAHRNTVRTCYPSPGIEADLGEETVYECNRWDPQSDYDVDERRLRREAARARHDAALMSAMMDSMPPPECTCGPTEPPHHVEDIDPACPLHGSGAPT